MHAPFVQVEYNQLLALARHFKHNATILATLRQQLQTMVDQLQPTWNGDAATKFFHEFETVVNPAIGRCHDVFLVAEQVTLQIRTLMRTAEEEAAALFNDQFGNLQAQNPAGSVTVAVWPPKKGPTKLPGGPVFDARGRLIRFDLTLAEFEMLTAEERIRWVEALEAQAGTPNWFHNIQDIIAFFDESHDMRNMRPGSWSSVADAGVLEAIQNGYRLHITKGAVPAGFNNCDGAAVAWQNFFDGHAAGKPDAKLLPLWAMAEQRGVNYGSRVANGWAGVPPAGTDEGDLIPQFVAYGNWYRFIARMENGGNDFVNRYTEVVGATVGSKVAANPATGYFTRQLDSFVDIFAPGYFPIKENLDLGLIILGSEAGAVVADYAVPDDAGSWFFDPRTTVGTDTYTNSRFTHFRKPELALTQPLIIHDTIQMTHGPTYYMGKVLDMGMIPSLPGVHVDPSGVLTMDNGTIIQPNGDAQLRDGTLIGTDGFVTKADGSRIRLDGTKFNPDGSYTLSDGSIAK
ncbi:WXG100 family type VII secretion target [Herpetosiphon sp. NSE202]|uniref:WXG100 family type VII secretion target n=1 Tax=Herpetosiphon sp. NSE202 TaxID=3351349 RepID=UPI003630CEEF